jgi:ribosome-associated protein
LRWFLYFSKKIVIPEFFSQEQGMKPYSGIGKQMRIPAEELSFEFFRASGPGGQNVNKVATAVRLRFDVRRSPSLTEPQRARLLRLAGRRLTEGGELLIESRRFRTQEANRQAAIERLERLVAQTSVVPKVRRPTRPTLASKQKRLEGKRTRSGLKNRRRPVSDIEE